VLHTVATTPDTTGGCTVYLRRVTADNRLATGGILAAAEFAVVAYTAAGGSAILTTDANVVNILATGRALADWLGARFIEPVAVCDYCARPVPAGTRHCTPRPTRNCAELARVSETSYRRLVA
jgi:hypothetical protein